MSNLILPDPKSPLQARAFKLLRALEGCELSRPELIELNDGRDEDTRRAVRFLRDNRYVYVTRYTEHAIEPVYAIGCEPDASVPRALYTKKKREPKSAPGSDVKLPPADPLMAALFARPATV